MSTSVGETHMIDLKVRRLAVRSVLNNEIMLSKEDS